MAARGDDRGRPARTHPARSPCGKLARPEARPQRLGLAVPGRAWPCLARSLGREPVTAARAGLELSAGCNI